MKKASYIIIFLIINFGGLAIGNWFMGDAVTGEWYSSLNKAPWTPPGWVFGFAWTAIMLCFSYYLAELFIEREKPTLWLVFLLAWLLNVSWNWFFFNQNMTNIGLFVLIALTLTILYFFITFRHDRLKWLKYLLVPYLIWLCIATSLNGYILFNN
ncbi:TspO/MBR family protein [Winogradskyella flava]|uniref:Tryptophan-rich sensory protein n=1 Tax=Winogradskyella flava TaxID=1884876 RepID=A0A842IY31_9FLAO|nr:TspO/MBR family protein [Winogradskyella flava]MBC2846187.1 tryptophan-rich sensory protein [Winogradskyella flava]